MEFPNEMHEEDDMENSDEMSEEAEIENLDKMGEADKMEFSLLVMVLDLLDSIEAQLSSATYFMMILVNSCDEMPACKHAL